MKLVISRKNDTFLFFENNNIGRLLAEFNLNEMQYKFAEHTDIERGHSVKADIENERLKAHGVIGHKNAFVPPFAERKAKR